MEKRSAEEALAEWSIQQIARLAGVTSRTLRHYGEIGLLAPSRIGTNGYRYYDQEALLTLQQILLLRSLGLGLPEITGIMRRRGRPEPALEQHLLWLRRERSRLDAQVTAVESTLQKLRRGERLMAEEMLDGFDHTQYKEEVEQRWGAQAYADSSRWWKDLGPDGQRQFQQDHLAVAADYAQAQVEGLAPDSAQVQAIAARHVEWLRGPMKDVTADYVRGLGRMYVQDPRFGKNYTARRPDGAELVSAALAVYADRNL